MNYNHYLPDTPQRIEYLKSVIGGRPCVVLLSGPSVMGFRKSSRQLKDKDICYASVNDYWVIENTILDKLDVKLNIVMRSAVECKVPAQPDFNFLDRQSSNAFISERAGYFESQMPLTEFLTKYGLKVLFFVAERSTMMRHVPNPQYPLHFFAQASFTILMSILAIGGAPLIIIFGADGGYIEGRELYIEGWRRSSAERLQYDAWLFNNTWPVLRSNLYRTHQINPRILNATPNTHYTAIKRIEINEAFNILSQESFEKVG